MNKPSERPSVIAWNCEPANRPLSFPFVSVPPALSRSDAPRLDEL